MIPFGNFSSILLMLIPLVPVVILGLSRISVRIRAIWLLLSSLFMLVLIYQPIYLLAQVTGFSLYGYALVRGFLAYKSSGKEKQPKGFQTVYILAVLASILPLVLVKFSPLFSSAGIWNTPIGFLGISYLTFKITGIIIEIRDGLIKEIKLPDFFLFILFFPTLASGPIDRYRRFVGDLSEPTPKKDYVQLVGEGINLIFRGLLYKFIIAFLINQYALTPLSTATGMIATIQYMYAYSFYLFFDFAGYSAFAIGTSYILGIKTPENFNKPFIAKNIKDFWNRWHMSLSFWFRDCIYMRFVLNSVKNKRFNSRYTSSYLGYLLLFGIMGIWHGTQLRYIAYGLYHAALMIGFDWLERQNKSKHFWGESRFWNILAIFITVHFVFLGFLIFSGRLF